MPKMPKGIGQMSDKATKVFTDNLSKYTKGMNAAAKGYTKADRGGSAFSKQSDDFTGQSRRGKTMRRLSDWSRKIKP